MDLYHWLQFGSYPSHSLIIMFIGRISPRRFWLFLLSFSLYIAFVSLDRIENGCNATTRSTRKEKKRNDRSQRSAFLGHGIVRVAEFAARYWPDEE